MCRILKCFYKTASWFLGLSLFGLSGAGASGYCPKPWFCEAVKIKIPYTGVGASKPKAVVESIRAGYYPEQGDFRGNILYFEGLGDSFLNHAPLFKVLSAAGYRVVAFDYMGQGGSSGEMNRTRVDVIPQIGKVIWDSGRFTRDLEHFPKKTILGWSTGGLAAYLVAAKNEASSVILIAPGIAPKINVGAGIFHWPPNEITAESLTSAAPYSKKESDPHLESIYPRSPLQVPEFSANLLVSAGHARALKIPASVHGLVLLSGDHDTYVNAEKTKRVLEKNAAHFEVIQYEGALHEIDNEIDEIQNAFFSAVIAFLKQSS